MSESNLVAQSRRVDTPSGTVGFLEQGQGPVALFVHGVFLNGHLWDGVMDGVADIRRCIAPDLLCHGATRERVTADVSFADKIASGSEKICVNSSDPLFNSTW